MRHIADTDRDRAHPKRAQRFLAQQKRAGVHPNTKHLQRRPGPSTSAGVAQFLKIERRPET